MTVTITHFRVIFRTVQLFMVLGALKIICFPQSDVVHGIFVFCLALTIPVGLGMVLLLVTNKATIACPGCGTKVPLRCDGGIRTECTSCGSFVLTKTRLLDVRFEKHPK